MSKYNSAYQADILMRMFNNNEKLMDEFHEQYRHACRVQFRENHVKDSDLKMLEMFRNGLSFSEISRITKLSYARVQKAVMYAALSKL